MGANREDYTILKEEIVQRFRDLEPTLTQFKNQIENKDITIFLGQTRSGKSTLVNYLLGNELEAWEERRNVFKIRTRGDCDRPEIGEGSLSCTTIPGVYSMPGDVEKVIVDAPGFEDNRGVVQDIINALFIGQIKTARTVKFVIVLDINDITNDNIGQVIHSFQYIQNLVRNSDELRNAFCIVFTKDFREYTQDEIVALLENKILNVADLDMNKVLVSNCALNKKLIGIFRMPSRAGQISRTEVDFNVKGAIEECHMEAMVNCQILFPKSDRTGEVLLDMYPEYTDTYFFEEQLNNITAGFSDYFNIDRWVYGSNNTELDFAKQSLEGISASLREQFSSQITSLLQIQISLDRLLGQATNIEFETNFKFVVVLDLSGLLEEIYKNKIIRNYKNSVEILCNKVNRLLIKINSEMDERRANNVILAGTGVTACLGAVPAVTNTVSKVRSAAAIFSTGMMVAGGCVVAVGVGAGYMIHRVTRGRRNDARRTQGRET